MNGLCSWKGVWKEASRKDLRATSGLRGQYGFYNGKYVPRDASRNGKNIAGRTLASGCWAAKKEEQGTSELLRKLEEELARMDIQVGKRTQVKMDAFMIRMQQVNMSYYYPLVHEDLWSINCKKNMMTIQFITWIWVTNNIFDTHRSQYILFLYDRGVQGSLHRPRLILRDSCRLLPQQVTMSLFTKGRTDGNKSLVFLVLLGFELETSCFSTYLMPHPWIKFSSS